MKQVFSLLVMLWASLALNAQQEGWHLLEADINGSVGIAAENIYKSLEGRSSKTIVVAVIDSGIDVEHEDLVDNIWVNPGEIAGNGIDDDNNGYIDDVNGWSFIGGPGGDVNDETLEVTRLYARDRYKFENADRSKLSKDDQKAYDKFLIYKAEVDKNRNRATERLAGYKESMDAVSTGLGALKNQLGDNDITLENVKSIAADEGSALEIGKRIVMEQLSAGNPVPDLDELKNLIFEDFNGAVEYFQGQLDFNFNPDFESRGLVGDNYADQTEKYYGNNHVEGPDALHGTHVGGIIGAVRDNGIGMDGVAANVRLMSVRAVPNGDERDKDVANAIRYAVDNGASIINMSFGKGFSWNEKIVEDAIKYAEKKDVLLVHAAGNSSQDNDTTDNFPNDIYKKKKFLGIFGGKEKAFKNWMEIGALNYENGENLAAPFSNYGTNNVDIFAPGMNIYATLPDNEYRNLQGTSMAAPVVAGVAAILRSYFPSLTAVQVKNILMASSTKLSNKVIVPGSKDTLKPFSELSVSGGVVNAAEAVKLAKITKGKNKVSKAKA